VDAVALAEQEALHARVPAARLVSEVDARFEQVAGPSARRARPGRSCWRGQRKPPRPPGGPASRPWQSPSRLCVRSGVCLPDPQSRFGCRSCGRARGHRRGAPGTCGFARVSRRLLRAQPAAGLRSPSARCAKLA
jgi:hypothetical protein